MAELTNLESKVAEVLGLAQAAKGATTKVKGLAEDEPELTAVLDRMAKEAEETARRCEELAGPLGLETAGIRASLDNVPAAEAWARQWLDGTPLTEKQFRRRSAPQVIRCAVRGLATGAVRIGR